MVKDRDGYIFRGRVSCEQLFFLPRQSTRPEKAGQLQEARVSPLLTAQSTPLEWQEWHQALLGHPDKAFTKYLVEGIREGFRTTGGTAAKGPPAI